MTRLYLLALTFTQLGAIPTGWFFEGKDRSHFEVTLDAKELAAGKVSARLRSVVPDAKYGALLQTVNAAHYTRQRVRFSAMVKASDVDGWTGLFVRVEGAGQKTLAFDNMQTRAQKGSFDWKRLEVVLDVSPDARRIHFGLGLSGRGTAWFDNARFETVGSDVPTTASSTALDGPTNLDLDE
ncbi:MAG: hypothetical protein K1X64_19910 [Myxococcaceae bacterium]|nr:hypothetical protein [Myxococcaceae bacterium]